MSQRKQPAPRSDFAYFQLIPTRWMDNDLYGHVNNVVYYSYFDTIINGYLIDPGGLDIHNGTIIAIAVETSCRFHRSFAFPEPVEAGLRVLHVGKSSVRYEVGLFGTGEESARAEGQFVHVFVERATRRPVAISSRIREALSRLQS